MRFRDRVVIAVLGASVVIAWLVWHPVGHWAALAVVIAGVLTSAAVYRLPPPAFGLRDPIRVPGVGLSDESYPSVSALPPSPSGPVGSPLTDAGLER